MGLAHEASNEQPALVGGTSVALVEATLVGGTWPVGPAGLREKPRPEESALSPCPARSVSWAEPHQTGRGPGETGETCPHLLLLLLPD